MEETIELESRKGYRNYLKRLKSATDRESTTYLLKVQVPQIWVTEKDNKIIALNCHGSPPLHIGDTIGYMGEIRSIDHILGYGYTITF